MDAQSPMALILVGQNELWDRLKLQAYACRHPAADRPAVRAGNYHDQSQTGAFIAKHLTYGGAEAPIFLRTAQMEIFSYSSGTGSSTRSAPTA